MKKALKNLTALILIFCIILSVALPSFALSGKWIKSGSRWWYRHSDASYTKNAWEKIDGKWYHFDSDGWMQTGWLKVGKAWYFLGGSGAMRTGWLKNGGNWYYLDSDGKMRTGWKKTGGEWYYFESSGAMKKGWLQLKDKWYYFDSSGAMVDDKITVGNKTYYFDTDGVYITFSYVQSQTVWYTFANDDRLNEHFEKHGVEMGYDSAQDYLAGANALINNPNALVKYETDQNDGDLVYYLEETDEILFPSQYGKIRTYFICSGRAYFDKQ